MSDDSITTDIHRHIDDKLAAGALVHPAFVATEILDEKKAIAGDDAPFYRTLAYKQLLRLVAAAIGKYAPTDETPKQLAFPGFKHLVKAYPMTRDGDSVLVPIELCTDAELLARAEQLDEMAKGCRDHGVEIRKYVKARAKIAASDAVEQTGEAA